METAAIYWNKVMMALYERRRQFGMNSMVTWIVWALFFFGSGQARATHLRAADILVERTCGTLTFKITVIAYMNSLSNTRFGTSSQILFGDGTFIDIPQTESTPRPDLGANVSIATFTINHTYPVPGTYAITYIERDRSSGVLNIKNSHDVAYVTSVKIDINDDWGCNRYPVLSVVPLDRGCSKLSFFHNPGAFDSDGDSLSYELSIPASSESAFADYTPPNDNSFYTDFDTGNEAGTGPPIFQIDALTGLITWDAPGMAGEYNIAFKVIEWRKNVNGQYVKLSTTTRDMQIIIEVCTNARPELQIPADVCIVAGTSVHGNATGFDADDHPVKIEAFSEILLFAPENYPAQFSPEPPEFRDPPATVSLDWNTTCSHVRQQPYQVVFKITDAPTDAPKLVAFNTWNIRVVAPPPVIIETVLDVVRQYALINWEKYDCENAFAIQVWRKVGGYNFSPGSCDIGIPRNSGFQLISEVNASDTTFTDTNFGMGLSPGAVYCYRLVALIGDTKSQVSAESCVGPVKRDAPVITHVSVEKTFGEGLIRVSWRSPLDIDRTQFPEPYKYAIYRADDFIGEEAIRMIGSTPDTTYLDTAASPKDSVYNYRIVLYSKPQFSAVYVPVDTSAVASTVQLEAIGGDQQIQLHWRDSVPWSSVVQARPFHLIYRSAGFMNEEDMVLYDSVNVIDNGFYYTDAAVDETQMYTYRILARGTYGNPSIPLQQNFSQAISVYPENDLVPCAPLLSLEKLDCDDHMAGLSCQQSEFTNVLTWEPDLGPGCRVDLASYSLYVGNGRDTLYTLVTLTAENGFRHEGLASPVACYRIAATDLQGNTGPKSDPVCNDTCPFFELPNVFTPNNDGCNDMFSARYAGSNDGPIECQYVNPTLCPRFVKSITFTVYNRWGREVFNSDSERTGSVFVDWDGKDIEGSELATGIYFYVAEVDFEVLDPGLQHRTYKDWVHLVR
jgi:hypothetical protein